MALFIYIPHGVRSHCAEANSFVHADDLLVLEIWVIIRCYCFGNGEVEQNFNENKQEQ